MPAGPPIAWMFAARLACVSTTPLGWDVEPEVNWSNAGALGSVDSAVRTRPLSSLQAATNEMVGADSRERASSGSSRGVVTIARARAARSNGAIISRYATFSPAWPGSTSGVGTSPAAEAPKVLADLSNGADRLDVVQRDRDVEAVLELGNQLEEEQGVEAEIEREIALGRRLDRPSADSLRDRDDLGFEHVARDVHRFQKISGWARAVGGP